MKTLARVSVLVCAALLGLALAFAMLQLPAPGVRLAEQVGSQLDMSGVTHPVTAVLLNFRGYDTLLEIAVLLLAMLGVLATGESASTASMNVSPQPQLQAAARILAPLMVLVAGYLLWAGSHQPGGAFQAGAVLAAAAILLYLAGLMPGWRDPGWLLRIGLVAGLLVFLSIAVLPLPQGSLLQYPLRWAGTLMFAIEAVLTFSLALILAGLFLWLPNENEEPEE